MLPSVALSSLVLVQVDFLPFLAKSAEHFRCLLCCVNQSMHSLAGGTLVYSTIVLKTKARRYRFLYYNISPIYPLCAYCQHLNPCHPLHIYKHLGYDNHRIIGRILQKHPDWSPIGQSRKLRSEKFGDFLKSTQTMRDWSGSCIWAFQV